MKPISPVSIVDHRFAERDFVGGDAACDFINTVTGRDQSPIDWVDSYGRLLEWAAMAQLLPGTTLRALEKKMRAEPAAAAAALARAKVLREGLFTLASAIVGGGRPPRQTLSLLREHWIAGVSAHALSLVDGHVIATLRGDAAGLDLVAHMVAYRMVTRVLQQPADRLRICDGPGCAWLFIDTSKAGRRRWCDMAVCGNAAKSRRFHARAPRPLG